jgi:hypothetical protein
MKDHERCVCNTPLEESGSAQFIQVVEDELASGETDQTQYCIPHAMYRNPYNKVIFNNVNIVAASEIDIESTGSISL